MADNPRSPPSPLQPFGQLNVLPNSSSAHTRLPMIFWFSIVLVLLQGHYAASQSPDERRPIVQPLGQPALARPTAKPRINQLVAPAQVNSTSDEAAGIDFFERKVRPLLIANCYECHSSKSQKRDGGLLLDSRSGWAAGGDSGEATIVPGDAEASRLVQAVRYTDEDLQMPPEAPLSPEEVAVLEQWIRMGAPDPRDDAREPSVGVDHPSNPIAGREHWAFQPLQVTAPPAVQDIAWPRSPIDCFVLASLEAAHLQPAADADRRTLVRRTYVDLIGLPPTAEQVDEFLQDQSSDAFERLVDRLLDSSHFGEWWGRHWLDLARYADSNGLDENFLFREAWRYRNWVLDAVNADMPFDQFLLQQIAGDLLPYDSIEQRDRQRIAAGFLVVGPKVLLGNDPQQRTMDVADEQLDTIGKAILGQTLGCARCHDHKFDPIPTADYYALAGIMTSTQVMQTRHMLNQQRLMERLVGLGPDGNQRNDAYEKYWREREQLQENLKQGKSALELLKSEKFADLAKLAEQHSVSVAPESLDESLTQEERIEAQEACVARLEAAVQPPEIPPRAMIPADVEEPADESIRLAGQFDRLGRKVPRGFLQVIGGCEIHIPEGQSGRMELADWLTNTQRGAGQLAARVLANRVWYHLMGRGLVRTVDNFGRTGEPPSHPELLDYLAKRLIDLEWSLKALIREIVLTRTFTMSSQHNEVAFHQDPENVLLWRSHRRRLTPESLRDAMLLAAGTLDTNPMDSTVFYLGDQATAVGANKNRRRTDFGCRSVYLPMIRNDLPEVFDAFDFADPHMATGMRPDTLAATQGLFMLNDPLVTEAAEAVARRILKETAEQPGHRTVEVAYGRILNATATREETDQLLSYIRDTRKILKQEGNQEAHQKAWAMACQALFGSSRFQIVE